MKYENKRNGQLFEQVGGVHPKYNTVFLRNVETGKEQTVTTSTLKRWYKKVEDPEDVVETLCVVPDAETTEEDTKTGAEADVLERVDSATTKSEKGMTPDVQKLHEYVLATCLELGGTIFVPAKDIKFRGLKVGKSVFVKYNWSNKAVMLQVRSKALGLDKPRTPVNHTYDDRYVFREYTEQAKQEIRKIMETCYNWQLERNLAKQK